MFAVVQLSDWSILVQPISSLWLALIIKLMITKAWTCPYHQIDDNYGLHINMGLIEREPHQFKTDHGTVRIPKDTCGYPRFGQEKVSEMAR